NGAPQEGPPGHPPQAAPPAQPGYDGVGRGAPQAPGYGAPQAQGYGTPWGSGSPQGPSGPGIPPGSGGPGQPPQRKRPWLLIGVAMACVLALLLVVGGGITFLVLRQGED